MNEPGATVVVGMPAPRRTRARRQKGKRARVTLHGEALHPDVARAVERVLTELKADESVSAGVVRAIQGLLAGPSTYVGKLDSERDYRSLLNTIIRELRKGTIEINSGEALRRAIKDAWDMTREERQEKQLASILEQLAALRNRPDAPALPVALDSLAFAASDLDGTTTQETAP